MWGKLPEVLVSRLGPSLHRHGASVYARKAWPNDHHLLPTSSWRPAIIDRHLNITHSEQTLPPSHALSLDAPPQTTTDTTETSMTTNRPFLGGFLAAFRAQPVLQKAATSQPGSYTAHTTTGAQSQGLDATSTTRTITSKTRSPSPGATTVSVQAAGHFQPTRQHAAPYHRSTSPKAKAFPIPGASQRGRRESDSSSEGFNEIIGAEKWYVGGRTATGEEKFYKLGMVKKHRSADRLSMDKLSI